MRKTLTFVLVEIAFIFGVWYAVAGPPNKRVMTKRAVTPEPHSIAELRKVDKVKPFPSCDFPSFSSRYPLGSGYKALAVRPRKHPPIC